MKPLGNPGTVADETSCALILLVEASAKFMAFRNL